jgi:hypothetical protein
VDRGKAVDQAIDQHPLMRHQGVGHRVRGDAVGLDHEGLQRKCQGDGDYRRQAVVEDDAAWAAMRAELAQHCRK